MKSYLLLWCGVLAAIQYAAMNLIVPAYYPGYDWTAISVSELSAIGAPTRGLWMGLGFVYSLLFIVFAHAAWRSAGTNRALKVAGLLLLVNGLLGLYWPPMHSREVIAAGGGNLTDNLHLVWTAIWVLGTAGAMVASAVGVGGRFKVATLILVSALMVAGVLTSMQAKNLEAGLPTPLMGFWERLNILMFLAWMASFALVLIRRQSAETSKLGPGTPA